jgi:hypothetical protein
VLAHAHVCKLFGHHAVHAVPVTTAASTPCPARRAASTPRAHTTTAAASSTMARLSCVAAGSSASRSRRLSL